MGAMISLFLAAGWAGLAVYQLHISPFMAALSTACAVIQFANLLFELLATLLLELRR